MSFHVKYLLLYLLYLFIVFIYLFKVDAYPFLALLDLTGHLKDAGMGFFWLLCAAKY